MNQLETKMPALHYVLSTVFSIQSGLDDEQTKMAYRTVLSDADFRRRLHEQLLSALLDDDFSWKHALYNSEYEVEQLDIEDEARAYAKRLLWDESFE